MSERTFTSLHRASYGSWAGNPKGYKPVAERCAEEVSCGNGSRLYCQCSRKRGHGPEEAYCKQHAKRHTKATGAA